jgi:tetratricopeptide (TPR) repeat protein
MVLSSEEDDDDDMHEEHHRQTTTTTTTSPRNLSVKEIETLTVVELKIELGLRGLKKTGNKPELQARLAQWCTSQSSELPVEQRGIVSKSSSSHSILEASAMQNHHHPWKRFERELLSWDIESSTLLKPNHNNNDSQKQPGKNNYNKKKDHNHNDESLLLRADSLAEWARTVDLQPLLHRRQAIHREKLKGKKKYHPKQPDPHTNANDDGSLDNKRTLPPAEEYRSVVKQMFERSSASKYSNWEVQQMYRAAKHADQAGDRDLCKRLLLELKTATPNDARIYRRLSRMEREDGNVNQARSILREGLARHPNNAFLWHGLGQLEASVGNVVAQKEYLRKAIEVDPSLPHSHHALGTLEHTQGQIANAMKTLKNGIEYCPTNHRLHHALGDLYRDAKMLDMASSSYRKALQHGPHVSHGFAYTALAYVAYEQDRPEECRRWLHRAIQVNDGRHANGWVSLAQFEESEGNIDAARAACLAAISQYERGLRKPSRNIQARQPNQAADVQQHEEGDPISPSRNDWMHLVPSYRSGDRFFNVYRNWARLEERYGTIETVEEVYERGIIAFSFEWKLTLDWAQYLAMLDMKDKARRLYAKSCEIANNRHADPYRQFAEFEMAHGNYDEARKILYSGAMKLLDENDFKSARHGMTELWYTWAVCEWHLGNLSHADTLFRQALSLTSSLEEGSKLKSFILYSMARLEYYREEYRRSQHYIGLCLKENLMPGGNSKVWDLWAAVAKQMGNDKLVEQCQNHAEQARLQEAASDGDPSGLSRLLAAAGSTKSSPSPDMQQLMRRDPWHQKIFGSSGTQFSSVFERLVLPLHKSLHRQLNGLESTNSLTHHK